MFSTIGYAICIPFAALLRLFYNLTGSYGVSLILFTLVIKLILLPFQMKSKKSMVRMSRMSGKMQEIQKKYANNQLKMQEDMQNKQAELEAAEYDVTSGGGMVKITISGAKEIKALKIDPSVVDPEDVEMLEDLIVAAVNEAINKVEQTAEEEMSKITSGLNIPGLGF